MENSHPLSLGFDSTLGWRDGVEHRPLRDGALLVDMNTGGCFRLNAVGAEVWGLLEEPQSVRRISEAIARHYNLEPLQVEADVHALLTELLQKGLLMENSGRR